ATDTWNSGETTSQRYSNAVFMVSATQTRTMATVSQRQSAPLSLSHQPVKQTTTVTVNPRIVLGPQHEDDAAGGVAKTLQPIRNRECRAVHPRLSGVIGSGHGQFSAIATSARRCCDRCGQADAP